MAPPVRLHPDDAVNAAIWDQIYQMIGGMVADGGQVALRAAPKSLRRQLSDGHRLGDVLEAFGVQPFLLELARERESADGGNRMLRLLVAPGRELHSVTRMSPFQMARLISTLAPYIVPQPGAKAFAVPSDVQVMMFILHVTQGTCCPLRPAPPSLTAPAQALHTAISPLSSTRTSDRSMT